MDDLTKLLELLQSIAEYLSWRVLLPSFSVSTAMLFLLQISLIRIILSDMYITIRAITMLICLLSLCGVIYKGIADLCTRLYEKARARSDENKRRKQIKDTINNLSPSEKYVFEYVTDKGGCAVWVNETDATVQTLIYKELLQQVGDKRCFEDWPFTADKRALCILVAIPQKIKVEAGNLVAE